MEAEKAAALAPAFRAWQLVSTPRLVSSPRFPCREGWEPAVDDASGKGGLKWRKMVAEPRVERAETGNVGLPLCHHYWNLLR